MISHLASTVPGGLLDLKGNCSHIFWCGNAGVKGSVSVHATGQLICGISLLPHFKNSYLFRLSATARVFLAISIPDFCLSAMVMILLQVPYNYFCLSI